MSDIEYAFYVIGLAICGLGATAMIFLLCVKTMEIILKQLDIYWNVYQYIVHRKKFKKWLKETEMHYD